MHQSRSYFGSKYKEHERCRKTKCNNLDPHSVLGVYAWIGTLKPVPWKGWENNGYVWMKCDFYVWIRNGREWKKGKRGRYYEREIKRKKDEACRFVLVYLCVARNGCIKTVQSSISQVVLKFNESFMPRKWAEPQSARKNAYFSQRRISLCYPFHRISFVFLFLFCFKFSSVFFAEEWLWNSFAFQTWTRFSYREKNINRHYYLKFFKENEEVKCFLSPFIRPSNECKHKPAHILKHRKRDRWFPRTLAMDVVKKKKSLVA